MTEQTPLVRFLLARLAEDERREAATLVWADVNTGRLVGATTVDTSLEVASDLDLLASHVDTVTSRRKVVDLATRPYLTASVEGRELAGRVLYALARHYSGHPLYLGAVMGGEEYMLEEYPPSHLAEDRPVPAPVGMRSQARDGTWWVAEGPTSWTEVPADGSGPLQRPPDHVDDRVYVKGRLKSPDCAAGKHAPTGCTGDAGFDESFEVILPCECLCHDLAVTP